jgi:HNH endonuclease
LARMTFGKKGRRVTVKTEQTRPEATKPPEEVVRDIKSNRQIPPGEDYRERSLAIHGLICARCAREFDESNRSLLTVHHRDGNHFNNPPDGSNWENLCVYCHEDAHSRGVLGEYLQGSSGDRQSETVYRSSTGELLEKSGLGRLGEKLRKALEDKKKT